MIGPFRGCRVTSLLVILVTLLFVERNDGYPYKWPEFFSYGNGRQPTPAKASSNERHVVTSVSSKGDNRDDQTSSETIHYVRSSLMNERGNGRTRVVDVGTREERTIGHESKNESIVETETDDEGESDRNISDEDNEDEITRLIEEAFHDEVFLTPEKWLETHVVEPLKAQTSIVRTGDRIIFPDELPNTTSTGAISRPVPSCKDSTFCLEAPYYPSDREIEAALKIKYLEPITEPSSISQRTGLAEDEDLLCGATEDVITPLSGVDEKDKWRIILNKKEYVQTVKVTICQSRDGACQIIDSPPTGYRMSCKQKYTYRQLVALGSNGTELTFFKTPSSCCCHLKFVGDVLTRMGINLDKINRQSPISIRNKN